MEQVAPARPKAAAKTEPASGRDVALLNAMLHTIIEENLYDEQYIQAHTEGFEALRAALDKSEKRVAEIDRRVEDLQRASRSAAQAQ